MDAEPEIRYRDVPLARCDARSPENTPSVQQSRLLRASSRVFGLFPVARMGGNANHRRSAYGRCVAELVFWAPAALLPGPGVVWEAVGLNTARVTVSNGELSQAVDLTVDVDGRPVEVSFMCWSNAPPKRNIDCNPLEDRSRAFATYMAIASRSG
ncbi:DUF6544 family protein [Marinobacterium aestuariivivens]|uniref:DUF6544 family protein n=1 Tax=Marinobacterium aestuariivivens TaxID=1698799 RepID=A0ABW2A1J8_9GAMM